jgi:hypothetical protein
VQRGRRRRQERRHQAAAEGATPALACGAALVLRASEERARREHG